MVRPELAHLELLADFDALAGSLRAWAQRAPSWPPAERCRTLVERLTQRALALRVRLDAPLVVATLGGTGTGKSTLVNAIVGGEVSHPGRERPTTMRPVLICRPDLTPSMLGIREDAVEVVHRDLPALADLVLLDCPDPDTTEDAAAGGTNLARLRELLPHCDVLLVTTTQQKYRSARVAAELAAAASGARLVFVQTHADLEDDIRQDWARVLADDYDPGDIFFVDSIAALAEINAGRKPSRDFARLVDLLTRELSGTASHRIRRANFLDLASETLEACRDRVQSALPAVGELERAIADERAKLATHLAARVRDELLGSRRTWEQRLVAEVASRWGFSPFACVLRIYLGLGAILSGWAFARLRSTAQVAVWGGAEVVRRVRRRRGLRQADAVMTRAAMTAWDAGELKTAAIIVAGYAAEAGLAASDADRHVTPRDAEAAAAGFLARATADVQSLVARLAGRHTSLVTRLPYELSLVVLLGLLLFRFGKNFFYDSWFAPLLGWKAAEPILGVDFFLGAGLVLVVWSGVLLWWFTARLRRGLDVEIAELAASWTNPALVAGIFHGLDARCRQARDFARELDQIQLRAADMRTRVTQPMPRLGHKQERTAAPNEWPLKTARDE